MPTAAAVLPRAAATVTAAAATGEAAEAVSASDITVMMNGLSGKMGLDVAAACMRRGMTLAPIALTAPGTAGAFELDDTRGGTAHVECFDGAEAAGVAEKVASLRDACAASGGLLIAIDYTHPSCVNTNAAFYAASGVPFVMGTTGGDRDALAASVRDSTTHAAVIAPNMGKQIVALQAAVARMAAEFPGAFAGYTLETVESHQSAKADTSGTAKAVVASLATLVDPAAADVGGFAADGDKTNAIVGKAIEDIERVRDEPTQLDGAGGRLSPVTPAAIAGHAYHTYKLTSEDGSVEFQLRHNVDGRGTYAEGTADAVAFLARRVAAGFAAPGAQRLFSMIDVLESGEI